MRHFGTLSAHRAQILYETRFYRLFFPLRYLRPSAHLYNNYCSRKVRNFTFETFGRNKFFFLLFGEIKEGYGHFRAGVNPEIKFTLKVFDSYHMRSSKNWDDRGKLQHENTFTCTYTAYSSSAILYMYPHTLIYHRLKSTLQVILNYDPSKPKRYAQYSK